MMTYQQQKGRGYGHTTVVKFCRLSSDAARRSGLSATAELGLLVQLTFYVFSAAVQYCKGRYNNTSLRLRL